MTMYERMLNKQTAPTAEDMKAYCGVCGEWFASLNEWLAQTYHTEQKIVFPYGDHYGWGVVHRQKQKLVCNVFAEKGAFTVMMRLSGQQFARVYPQMQPDTQRLIDERYPCGDGGWIHYRVTGHGQLCEVQTMLAVKCSKERA